MNEHDHIDDYLDGQLNASDAKAFEEAMASDDGLKKAVALNRNARKLLRVAAHQAQRDRIKALDTQSSRSRTKVWRSAAAIALLLSLPLLWFVLRPADTSITAEYFEPYPDRISTMGTPATSSLADAMEFYNKGDYRKALDAFEALTPKEDQADLINLYMGVSHLALGQCDEASSLLNDLRKEGSIVHEAASWYHLLALVDCSYELEARSALESYLDNPQNRFNRSKAELLLKALE